MDDTKFLREWMDGRLAEAEKRSDKAHEAIGKRLDAGFKEMREGFREMREGFKEVDQDLATLLKGLPGPTG